MTLKVIQGFETVQLDSDFRAQGWWHYGNAAGGLVQAVPSVSGVAGKSAQLLGSFASSTNFPGVVGQVDYGWAPTGVTVNQAWLAGGFAMGVGAKFNQATPITYSGVVKTVALSGWQLTFDGTRYWAIQNNTGVYSVVYSTDLLNWTAITLPSNAQLQVTTTGVLQFIGNGILAWFPAMISANQYTGLAYTSTNNGATWTTTSFAASFNYPSAWFAYGNATTPLVIFAENGVAADNGIYVGTPGGTSTRVAIAAATGTGVDWAGVVNGYLVFSDNAATLTSALQSSNLASAGSWTTITTPSNSVRSAVFFNGLYLLALSGGIISAPSLSAATASWVTRLASIGMGYLATNGSVVICSVYNAAGLYTSPDGIPWTKLSSNAILNIETITSLIYDGTRFVLTTLGVAPGMGLIMTSPDGFNWTVVYAAEMAEQTTNTGYSLAGVVSGSAVNVASPGAATFTQNGAIGVQPGIISAGSRQINLSTNTTLTVGTLSNTVGKSGAAPGYNYYELVAVAGGTPNSFVVSLRVNGVQLGASQISNLGTSSADVTSQLLVNLPRTGQFTMIDDVYFLSLGGAYNPVPLGPINVVLDPVVSDSQAQWTRDGAEASNAAAVKATALSNAAGYVTSSTVGNKDIYATTGSIPASPAVVKALMVEAFMSSSAADSVSVGLVSNGVEVDQTPVALSSAAYVYSNQIVEADPKTNAAWTLAGANAVDAVITKTA